MTSYRRVACVHIAAIVCSAACVTVLPADEPGANATVHSRQFNTAVSPHDWPQLGGSPSRNNAVDVVVPTEWDVKTGKNIKWSVPLGSQTYGHTVVANGKVFVGTNNGHDYLTRYSATTDLGVLLCFRESDGEFMWQHSSEKLLHGRVHDWPEQGVCSAPVADGDRLWFVTNRGEVVCLDAQGFYDAEDDGTVKGVSGRVCELVARFDDLAELLATRSLPPEHFQTFLPAIQQAGLPPFYETAPADEPNQWFGVKSDASRTRMLRLTLNDSTLTLEGLGDYAGKRLEIRLDPLAELRSGHVPALVRMHFKRRGIDISDDAQPVALGSEERWSVAAVLDGGRIECRLEALGTMLVCRQKVSQIEKEADVVWSLDMMKELGVRQHNMATCAPTIWGDVLFVVTSNGVDEAHQVIPAPDAPSFIAMDKRTGEVLWTDKSPGKNILHGQWSCPAAGVLGGVPQVIFPGGDGWLYAFRADRWDREGKKPELLWKFDANPKNSVWELGGRGTRNNIIAVPVIHDGLVYSAVGQDPEHGEGQGHLWCVDPKKRGDVSPELVVDDAGIAQRHHSHLPTVSEIELFSIKSDSWNALNEGTIGDDVRNAFRGAGFEIPAAVEVQRSSSESWQLLAQIDGKPAQFHISSRWIANDPARILIGRLGLTVVSNPNSAVVWHYAGIDTDGDGKFNFYETMHRTLGGPSIKDGLLVITDLTGLVHCLDAKTGQQLWSCDLFGGSWATPLIAADQIYVGDEDGEIAILPLTRDPGEAVPEKQDNKGHEWRVPAHQIDLESAIFTSPVVANGVLYVGVRNRLYAIAKERSSAVEAAKP